MQVTTQMTEATRTKLRAAEPETARGKIMELLPEIEAARRRQVPYETILAILKEEGITVTKRTLQDYLAAGRRKAKGGKSKSETAKTNEASAPPAQAASKSTRERHLTAREIFREGVLSNVDDEIAEAQAEAKVEQKTAPKPPASQPAHLPKINNTADLMRSLTHDNFTPDDIAAAKARAQALGKQRKD